MPVPAKTHMKVKCHWSAPPSHPPKVEAFGMSTMFFCGTLGPKLGKARKIRSPLVTRTKTETAFSQWQKRTTQGCSNAARTLPFGFSAKPARTSAAWLGRAGSAESGASTPPAEGEPAASVGKEARGAESFVFSWGDAGFSAPTSLAEVVLSAVGARLDSP